MSTNLTEYYVDELTDWSRMIAFYYNEKEEMEQKLAEVIQRNTIPNIALKVEEEEDKLTNIVSKFYDLDILIKNQLANLKNNNTFIDDSQIGNETEQIQNELRRSMHQAEKEYVDVKYSCLAFILKTLKK